MKYTKVFSSSPSKKSYYVRAAEDDDFEDFEDEPSFDDDEDFDEGLDEEEEEEEPEEELEEDQPNIEVDNNIEGKYIAECDSCHGIFISAVSESDQKIDCISGICPLCNHQTNQYLKWIIKPVEDEIV